MSQKLQFAWLLVAVVAVAVVFFFVLFCFCFFLFFEPLLELHRLTFSIPPPAGLGSHDQRRVHLQQQGRLHYLSHLPR